MFSLWCLSLLIVSSLATDTCNDSEKGPNLPDSFTQCTYKRAKFKSHNSDACMYYMGRQQIGLRISSRTHYEITCGNIVLTWENQGAAGPVAMAESISNYFIGVNCNDPGATATDFTSQTEKICYMEVKRTATVNRPPACPHGRDIVGGGTKGFYYYSDPAETGPTGKNIRNAQTMMIRYCRCLDAVCYPTVAGDARVEYEDKLKDFGSHEQELESQIHRLMNKKKYRDENRKEIVRLYHMSKIKQY
eukprot:3835_1